MQKLGLTVVLVRFCTPFCLKDQLRRNEPWIFLIKNILFPKAQQRAPQIRNKIHKLRCYTRISGPEKSLNNSREKISVFLFF